MSNGLPVPYFGILGQEITAAMAQKGMPKGIYISEAVMDSPAYNAGLQPGDILTKLGDMPVITATMNYASPRQLFMKRCLDVTGG